jgi:hypothetical protein
MSSLADPGAAPVNDIAADPVSRLLATGASDGSIRVYPWPGQ